nr:hypothetical protein Iba_chr09bCG13980 [Ipomoea batatas]
MFLCGRSDCDDPPPFTSSSPLRRIRPRSETSSVIVSICDEAFASLIINSFLRFLKNNVLKQAKILMERDHLLFDFSYLSEPRSQWYTIPSIFTFNQLLLLLGIQSRTKKNYKEIKDERSDANVNKNSLVNARVQTNMILKLAFKPIHLVRARGPPRVKSGVLSDFHGGNGTAVESGDRQLRFHLPPFSATESPSASPVWTLEEPIRSVLLQFPCRNCASLVPLQSRLP